MKLLVVEVRDTKMFLRVASKKRSKVFDALRFVFARFEVCFVRFEVSCENLFYFNIEWQ